MREQIQQVLFNTRLLLLAVNAVAWGLAVLALVRG